MTSSIDEVVTDVVGVVLAAGSSRRLGRPKQTLAFGDRTLLAHVVADVERSTLDRVVVVLQDAGSMAGFRSDRVELVPVGVEGGDCSSSLLAGLEAAGQCGALVLLLGDMPGVTPEVIDQFVATWRAAPTWAAIASYRDGLGHPFLFSALALPALRALHGDKAIWKIVDRESADRVARISIDKPTPRDIDTWDDYRSVRAAFGFEPEAPGPT